MILTSFCLKSLYVLKKLRAVAFRYYYLSVVLCACVHICCQNMGDKLKKEHEELKAELKKLIKEHEVLQTKMANKLDRNFDCHV